MLELLELESLARKKKRKEKHKRGKQNKRKKRKIFFRQNYERGWTRKQTSKEKGKTKKGRKKILKKEGKNLILVLSSSVDQLDETPVATEWLLKGNSAMPSSDDTFALPMVRQSSMNGKTYPSSIQFFFITWV